MEPVPGKGGAFDTLGRGNSGPTLPDRGPPTRRRVDQARRSHWRTLIPKLCTSAGRRAGEQTRDGQTGWPDTHPGTGRNSGSPSWPDWSRKRGNTPGAGNGSPRTAGEEKGVRQGPGGPGKKTRGLAKLQGMEGAFLGGGVARRPGQVGEQGRRAQGAWPQIGQCPESLLSSL